MEKREQIIPRSVASYNNSYTFVPATENFTNTPIQYLNSPSPTYLDIVAQSRYFYSNDPIASIVVNRICEIAITPMKVRRNKHIPVEVHEYYKETVKRLAPYMITAAMEYLIQGAAIPQYTLKKQRLDLYTSNLSLGRTRVSTIDHIWNVDSRNVTIKRSLYGDERLVYLNIPLEHVGIVSNKTKNTEYKKAYEELRSQFPEYVARIEKGDRYVPTQSKPMLRKILSHNDYPIPYLQPALTALRHKAALKAMDYSLAQKALEAVRHVQIGTDTIIATQPDIDAAESSLKDHSANNRVYNWITPHYYSMKWIYPPLDILTSDTKYLEPNSDIFTALGFPRILTIGETLRSNTSDASIAIYGPKATMKEIRDSITNWVIQLFKALAEENNFVLYPEPYFTPISETNAMSLLQLAGLAMTNGTVSKDFIAQILGTTYEDEKNTRELYEEDETEEEVKEEDNTNETEGKEVIPTVEKPKDNVDNNLKRKNAQRRE